MLKDLEFPKVEGVAVAIVPDKDPLSTLYHVHIINLKKKPLTNVLITSKGYEKNGEAVKTSVLRHYIECLEGHQSALIEPISSEVFGLNNEYWVSFYIDSTIYDKKFIFLPETIQEQHFIDIPILETKGVLIA